MSPGTYAKSENLMCMLLTTFCSHPSENAATSGDNRDVVNIVTETNADLCIQV